MERLKLLLTSIILIHSVTAIGQSNLSVHAKIGLNKVNSSDYVIINNHEAYILGREDNSATPKYFGLDVNKPLTNKISIAFNMDFSTKFTEKYELLTNSHHISNGNPYHETHEFEFAPIFLSSVLKYDFQLLKHLTISPNVGGGIRFTNFRGHNILNAQPQITGQLTEIIQAFESSIKKSIGFFKAGGQLKYKDLLLEVEVMTSFNSMDNYPLLYKNKEHYTEASKTFVFLGIGYRLF